VPVNVRVQNAPPAYDVRDQVELRRQITSIAAQAVTASEASALVGSGSSGVLVLDGGTPSAGGAPYITDGGTP
jgi:hypothetical protein